MYNNENIFCDIRKILKNVDVFKYLKKKLSRLELN